LHELAGGEELSLVCEGVVLKRVQGPECSAWSQALLADVPLSSEFRLPRPLASSNGDYVVDGWIATEFIPGLSSLRHDPSTIVRVGEALSDVLTEANCGDSSVVTQRQDRWARADRYVWSEETVALSTEAAAIAANFRTRMSSDHGTPAVVHGDLSGNVFVDPLGTPVVLDFSPYIRPKRYASAIVVADNLLWHDGEPTLTRLIANDDDALARALLFRMVAEQLGPTRSQDIEIADYHRVLAALGWV